LKRARALAAIDRARLRSIFPHDGCVPVGQFDSLEVPTIDYSIGCFRIPRGAPLCSKLARREPRSSHSRSRGTPSSLLFSFQTITSHSPLSQFRADHRTSFLPNRISRDRLVREMIITGRANASFGIKGERGGRVKKKEENKRKEKNKN